QATEGANSETKRSWQMAAHTELGLIRVSIKWSRGIWCPFPAVYGREANYTLDRRLCGGCLVVYGVAEEGARSGHRPCKNKHCLPGNKSRLQDFIGAGHETLSQRGELYSALCLPFKCEIVEEANSLHRITPKGFLKEKKGEQ
ncbi:hypothetical protein ATANTOWER_028792, partial [Ataeniobius toweri]|nr:hypothetical protein [Ataeniobius toweri]